MLASIVRFMLMLFLFVKCCAYCASEGWQAEAEREDDQVAADGGCVKVSIINAIHTQARAVSHMQRIRGFRTQSKVFQALGDAVRDAW